MRKLLSVFCTVSLLLCGCSAGSDPAVSSSPSAAVTEEPVSEAERKLNDMTLEEKVGQMFMVRIDALDPGQTLEEINDSDAQGVTEWNDALHAQLAEIPVGGVAVFGKNIQSPDQLKALTAAIQKESTGGMHLFIGVDEEGGRVARLANSEDKGFDLPQYESMAAVGASGDVNQALNAGLAIGTYLKEYGFNLDFAPDADVNTNPDNPVIGDRAFSSDPNIAAEMVSSAVTGFHQAGIMTSIKHFPGHGNTAQDTHKGYATTDKAWDEMMQCEMLPFESGIQAGTDMVMVSHITAPNVTDDGLPASLSYEMITGKLRNTLNYDGVVITDSLSMEAITDYYSAADACILSIQAGADILLMPNGLQEAYEGVLKAVRDGTISEERIDESVRRILNLKEQYGLLDS